MANEIRWDVTGVVVIEADYRESSSKTWESVPDSDSVTEAPGADEGLGWNRKTAALALLSFAMLTVSLDQYIVVVALPEIGRELGYSAQTLQSGPQRDRREAGSRWKPPYKH
jgi:hypothetical protein